MTDFVFPILTEHARQRMAQRGLSLEDVLYAYNHGHPMHRAGAQHRVLRRIDIPSEDAQKKARLNGLVVVLDRFGTTVMTVYRNRDAPKRLRHKPKWGWKREIPAL